MPEHFFQTAANGACFIAFAADGKSLPQGPSGGSSIEANRPLSGRFTNKTVPARSRTTKAAPRFSGRAVFGALTGKLSCIPRLRAKQCSVHGQFGHAGRLGTQIALPKSMSA